VHVRVWCVLLYPIYQSVIGFAVCARDIGVCASLT